MKSINKTIDRFIERLNGIKLNTKRSNNNNYDFFIYLSYIITFASLIIVFLYTYLKYLISKKLFKAIIENVNDPQKK